MWQTSMIPDKRRHRGPHPADEMLFASPWQPQLRDATFDLSWLQDRRYAAKAALDTVGDRYGLQKRQRRAVLRAACGDRDRAKRWLRRVELAAVAGQTVAVDGFNSIITIESALAGGLVVVARDGCHRDIASVHGTYRKVHETERACELIGATLAEAGATSVHIYLDRPVSNSGRLRAVMEDMALERAWPWQVELANNPDKELAALAERTGCVVASNDGWVMERSQRWLDLPGAVIERHVPDAWLLDLRDAVTQPAPSDQA